MKRLILVGKAGSGKDYLRDGLVASGLTKDVSVTTRPMRMGEVAGDTYHYVTPDEFQKLIENGSMHEHECFNGWHYGTLKHSWQTAQVVILTALAVKKLAVLDRAQSLVVYLDIPFEARRERLAKRSDADSVTRRIAADAKDFADFRDYDVAITDPNFDREAWVLYLKTQLV